MGAIDLTRFSGCAAVSQNFSNLNVQDTNCTFSAFTYVETETWLTHDTCPMLHYQKPAGLMTQVSYDNRLSEFLLFSWETINALAVSEDTNTWKSLNEQTHY